jgi:WD40 repeat protein
MSATGKVILWDLQTLRPLDTIAGNYGNRSKNARSVVQFHPSGSYYVFADLDGVRVVALKDTPNILPRLDLPAEVIHLGFSRKGDRLAVFRADQRLSLYEVPSGRLLRTVEIRLWKKGEPFALSPDADFLVVVIELNNIILYSFDQKGTYNRLGQHNGGVTDIAFTPDGRQVISASLDGTVRRWQLEFPLGAPTNGDLWTIPVNSHHSLALSTDGQFLILVDKTPMGSLSMRATVGGSHPLVTYVLEDSKSFLFSGKVIFSPTGDRIIVERHGLTVQGLSRPFLDIVYVEGKTEKRRFVGNSGPIGSLAFHPSRPLAVTAQTTSPKSLTFWDLEKCVPVRLWEDQSAGSRAPLAFSPDGTLLATTLAGKPNAPESLVLRDLETGAIRGRVPEVVNPIDLTFSPSGKILGVVNDSQKRRGHLIRLTDDPPSLKPFPERELTSDFRVRFVGKSDRALTLGFNGEMDLSDSGDGVRRQDLDLKHLSIFELSEDGRLLVGFCPEQNRYVLYQFPEMTLLAEAPQENRATGTSRVSGHPFNANNRYVVTIDAMRTPQLRSGRTLERLFDFPSQKKLIKSTDFSPEDFLAVVDSNIDSGVTLYDLRKIRSKLAELGLDWSDED